MPTVVSSPLVAYKQVETNKQQVGKVRRAFNMGPGDNVVFESFESK